MTLRAREGVTETTGRSRDEQSAEERVGTRRERSFRSDVRGTSERSKLTMNTPGSNVSECERRGRAASKRPRGRKGKQTQRLLFRVGESSSSSSRDLDLKSTRREPKKTTYRKKSRGRGEREKPRGASTSLRRGDGWRPCPSLLAGRRGRLGQTGMKTRKVSGRVQERREGEKGKEEGKDRATARLTSHPGSILGQRDPHPLGELVSEQDGERVAQTLVEVGVELGHAADDEREGVSFDATAQRERATEREPTFHQSPHQSLRPRSPSPLCFACDPPPSPPRTRSSRPPSSPRPARPT